MISWLRLRLPIRVKLTAWYVLLLGLTLTGSTGYLYLRLEHKLMTKVDSSLQIASAQSLLYIDSNNGLLFQKTPQQRTLANRLSQLGLAARLITPAGKIADGFGRYREVPTQIPVVRGYTTFSTDDGAWRLMSQPIVQGDRTIGWFQIIQSLESLQAIAQELPSEILLDLPWLLILAACGGLFLANRLLSPIQSISKTARTITVTDLSQRIHYRGAMDEIGELAMTVDQMLDRLQSTFEREQRFTAAAVHELRTPLTAIKVRLDVTRSRPRSPEEYEQVLQDLEYEVERLIRLSNGLLLLAKLDRERFLPIVFQSVDLSTLLSILIEQLQPLAETQAIALNSQVQPELWVQGDTDRLTSLFLNLLDNAIKYTPAPGRVSVVAQEETGSKNQVRVLISNTGPGIPADELPRIFERFYRVETARSQTKTVAGLGLAIAHDIAHLHGATLTAQSEPNRETIFTVVLPIDSQS
jgi:signal transduction histidine kinase